MLTAIIPARGGSRGLPGKNLEELAGKSLVWHAANKAARVADRVVVSSDCPLILAEAAKAGAVALLRPDHLALDETSSEDVYRHAIDELQLTGEVLAVQCTAPIATSEDYQRCVDDRGGADMSVLCHRFHGFVLDGDGRCVNRQIVPAPRRQDMNGQWLIAGSAWCFGVAYLARYYFYGGVVKPVPQRGPYCDIDTADDLRTARAMGPRWSSVYAG